MINFIYKIFSPFFWLISGISLAIICQLVNLNKLLIFNSLLLIFTSNTIKPLLKQVYRLRWLLGIILLTTSYQFPGDAILDLSFLPTYDGLEQSLVQLMRIFSFLLIINLIQKYFDKEDIIASLYHYLRLMPQKPYNFFMRLIIRILLCLEYLKINLEHTESLQEKLNQFLSIKNHVSIEKSTDKTDKTDNQLVQSSLKDYNKEYIELNIHPWVWQELSGIIIIWIFLYLVYVV